MTTLNFSTTASQSGPVGNAMLFLRESLASPSTVASVWPSSSAVQNAIVSLPAIQSATNVVELGPGTGSITSAILSTLPAHGRLVAIEQVPTFADELETIDDDRLTAVCTSAENLAGVIEAEGMSKVDTVVSGVPFSQLPAAVAERIISASFEAIRPGGYFVTYQLRRDVCDYANRVFGPQQTTEFVGRNLPPLFVRTWRRGTQRRRYVSQSI